MLRIQTLLVETTRKAQTDNLKRLPLSLVFQWKVTDHKTLNSSKGIIRDKTLKMESEENILEYLKSQGVTNVKRLKIKRIINL